MRTVAGIVDSPRSATMCRALARFSTPLGVMFDSDHTRNLYVTDYSNGVVRVIHGGQTASPTIAPSTLTPTRTLAPTAAPSGRGIVRGLACQCHHGRQDSRASKAPARERDWQRALRHAILCHLSHGRGKRDLHASPAIATMAPATEPCSSTFQDLLGMELDYLNRSRVLLYVADSGAHKIRRVDCRWLQRHHCGVRLSRLPGRGTYTSWPCSTIRWM